MTMSVEMQERMVRAFGARYAGKSDVDTCGYLLPQYVADRDYLNDGELYFDLGRIAKGECGAGQSTTAQRSNYRRLCEDFPGAFTHISFMNVNVLGAFAADIDDDLAEMLIDLADSDSGMYDSDDVDALESDEIGEAWDSYLKWDLHSELSEIDQESMDAIDVDALGREFYNQLTELDYYPQHDGYEVRWDTDKAVSALRAAIAALTPAPHGWATAGAI